MRTEQAFSRLLSAPELSLVGVSLRAEDYTARPSEVALPVEAVLFLGKMLLLQLLLQVILLPQLELVLLFGMGLRLLVLLPPNSTLPLEEAAGCASSRILDPPVKK